MSGLSCVSLPLAERSVTAERVADVEGGGDPLAVQTASGHCRHLQRAHRAATCVSLAVACATLQAERFRKSWLAAWREDTLCLKKNDKLLLLFKEPE